MYRFDASYALEVRAAHPGRFALIKPVDPADPKVADVIADWAARDGTVAVRIMLNDSVSPDPADPGITRVLAAAAKHSMPVNILAWGRLDQAQGMAARNPDTTIVVDHLGLQQPFDPPAPPEPFADLPKVLKLAAHKNVVIKISGACTLSPQAVPLSRHLGPGAAHHRRLRPRPLHVGHRLDARRGAAHLQAGRRRLPPHRPPLRQRPRQADGRHPAEGLRLGPDQGLGPAIAR